MVSTARHRARMARSPNKVVKVLPISAHKYVAALALALSACSNPPTTHTQHAGGAGRAGAPGGAGQGSGAGGEASQPHGGRGAAAGERGGGSAGEGGKGGAPDNTPDDPIVPTEDGCNPRRPEQVPTSWVPFTEFDCDAPLWHPTSREDLPPPIEWEPCPVVAAEPECQSMKVTWPHRGGAISLQSALAGDRLLFLRSSGTLDVASHMMIVADADGPVHFAFVATRNIDDGLRVTPAGLAEDGRAGVELHSGPFGTWSDYGENQALVLMNPADMTLSLFRHEQLSTWVGWHVGGPYAVRLAVGGQRADVFLLDSGKEYYFGSSADDQDSLQIGTPVIRGGAVFMSMGNLRYSGVRVFTPDHGTRDFIRWPGDNQQGAIKFGTDGADMVWTHGTQHPDGEGVYAEKSIMTAPFTVDSGSVAGRRLASDATHGYGRTFVVGCGRAAHNPDGDYIEVLSLADGKAWRLDVQVGFGLRQPIALTCEHLYFESLSSHQNESGPAAMTISRVRIDNVL